MPENKCKTYGAEIKDGVCQDTRPNALICVNCSFRPKPGRREAPPGAEQSLEVPVENLEVETQTSDEQLEVDAVEEEQEQAEEVE